MAYELAVACKKRGGIGQRAAPEKAHVHVRSDCIDVAEGRISHTCDWRAVMQKLPDFVPRFRIPETDEPMRDSSQSRAFWVVHASIHRSRDPDGRTLNRSKVIVTHFLLTRSVAVYTRRRVTGAHQAAAHMDRVVKWLHV